MDERTNPLYCQVLDEWIDEHKLKIMESTAYGYKKALPAMKQYFSLVCIRDIGTEVLYNYMLYLKTHYSLDKCARLYGKIMRLSFRYAQKMGYITYNPAEDVAIPGRARAEIYPFTELEMEKVLKQDGLAWVKQGIVIAYRTGMRLGEIFALRWSDINFEEKFIMVQRAQSRANSKVILKTTKTRSGVRRVELDNHTISYLYAMMQTANGCPYVFAPPSRAKYSFRVPYNISKYLRAMCVAAGVAERNFHQIRHTHATILMAHGIHPKVVQERLGHSSIMITLDIYSHVTPTIQGAAVEVFNKIF